MPVPFTSRPRRFLVLSLSLIACCFLKQKQMDTERFIWLQEMCVKGPVQNLQDLYKSYVQSLGLTEEARSENLRIFILQLVSEVVGCAGGEAGEAYCEGSCQANP